MTKKKLSIKTVCIIAVYIIFGLIMKASKPSIPFTNFDKFVEPILTVVIYALFGFALYTNTFRVKKWENINILLIGLAVIFLVAAFCVSFVWLITIQFGINGYTFVEKYLNHNGGTLFFSGAFGMLVSEILFEKDRDCTKNKEEKEE